MAHLVRYYQPDKAERMIAGLQRQERVTIRLQIEDVIAEGFDE
jgi:hypothetical protein